MSLLNYQRGKMSRVADTELTIKKAFGRKKLAPNGSRSGNVAPQMVADQEVGSPQLFLTVCFIAELKTGGRVSH